MRRLHVSGTLAIESNFGADKLLTSILFSQPDIGLRVSIPAKLVDLDQRNYVKVRPK